MWKEKCKITDGGCDPEGGKRSIKAESQIGICGTDNGATEQSRNSVNAQEQKIQDLELKVANLEESANLSRPLLEIGISVRKRFFEQTKLKLLKQEANKEVVEEGNLAAHQPNIIADISLLLLRPKLKDAYITTLKAIFPTEFDEEGNLPSLRDMEWNDRIAEIANIRAMARVENLKIPEGQLDLMEKTVMKILELRFGGRFYGDLDAAERKMFMSNGLLNLILKQTRGVLDSCLALRESQ